jgi:transporter family protein
MWVTLTLICAALLGCYKIAKKLAVRDNRITAVTLVSTLAALCAAAVRLLVTLLTSRGAAASLPPGAHPRILIKSAVVSSSWLLSFGALKHLPLSFAAPIRESSPLWRILGAVVLFDEQLGLLQLFAAALVMAGYYAFTLAGKDEGIELRTNRWVVRLIAATLLASTSSLYDKHLLSNLGYSVTQLQFWFYAYNTAILTGVFAVDSAKKRATSPFQLRPSVVLAGLLLFLADLSYFYAVSAEGSLIAIISVLRRASVLLPFVVGVTVLKEKASHKKVVALLLLLTGIASLTAYR